MIVWRAYSRAASAPIWLESPLKHRADDLVRQLLAELDRLRARRRPWPRRPGARSASFATVPPRTTAGLSRTSSDALVTVPLRRPSSRRRSACTSGTLDRGLGADGPQRAEPDAEVADLCAGSPCRTSSVAVVPSPPKKSPLIGDERSAPPGTRSWYGPARRREDAEIDLGRAVGRAGRPADDGHLVDDEVAAAQQRAEAVRADGERDDQRPAS